MKKLSLPLSEKVSYGELIGWCHQNLEYSFSVWFNNIEFEHIDDMLLYRLTWL